MSPASAPSLMSRALAEAAGTGLLVAAGVGAGVMAERLCGDNVGLALLACSLATPAVLYALILTFMGVSGAHLNPAVTLAELALGRMRARDAGVYVVVQVVGALAGVLLVHAMFELPLWQLADTARPGPGRWLGEIVATATLLVVIAGVSRHAPTQLAAAVAATIVGAYWFTSSTSFANPAVTFARVFTDTFCGIAPRDAVGFVVAELVGALVGAFAGRALFAAPTTPTTTTTTTTTTATTATTTTTEAI
jgi:glycerol uptake facilitator-like aquaporin